MNKKRLVFLLINCNVTIYHIWSGINIGVLHAPRQKEIYRREEEEISCCVLVEDSCNSNERIVFLFSNDLLWSLSALISPLDMSLIGVLQHSACSSPVCSNFYCSDKLLCVISQIRILFFSPLYISLI